MICILFFKTISSLPQSYQALTASLGGTLALLTGLSLEPVQHAPYSTLQVIQKNTKENAKQGKLQQNHTLLAQHSTANQCTQNLGSQLSTPFGTILPGFIPSTCLSGCHLLVKQSYQEIKKTDCCTQSLTCCQDRKLDRFEIVCPENIHFVCCSSLYLSSWYFSPSICSSTFLGIEVAVRADNVSPLFICVFFKARTIITCYIPLPSATRTDVPEGAAWG